MKRDEVKMKFCNFCEKYIEENKKIGVATLILVLLTCGFWVLAIIFYEKRCPMCNGINLGIQKK